VSAAVLDSVFGRPGSGVAEMLDALARALVRAGVAPNTLTYVALAAGVAAGDLFYLGRHRLAFAVLLVSGLCDAVDGRVARLGPGATPWGGVLDLTADRIVEVAVLLGIALPHRQLHRPALVLAGTWYVNLCVFLAVGAASTARRDKLIAYPPGLLERSEGLLFAFAVVVRPRFAAAATYLYAALGVVTAAQRLWYARRALR
jgi:archaetidylinositol phosphate synthase